MLAFIALIPDALELVEMVLDQAKQGRRLSIARAVDSLRQALHIGSNCPVVPVANKILCATKRRPGGGFVEDTAARRVEKNLDPGAPLVLGSIGTRRWSSSQRADH
jgi:hypothetical protein